MRAIEKEKKKIDRGRKEEKNDLRWLEKTAWFVNKEEWKAVQKIMFKEKEK